MGDSYTPLAACVQAYFAPAALVHHKSSSDISGHDLGDKEHSIFDAFLHDR